MAPNALFAALVGFTALVVVQASLEVDTSGTNNIRSSVPIVPFNKYIGTKLGNAGNASTPIKYWKTDRPPSPHTIRDSCAPYADSILILETEDIWRFAHEQEVIEDFQHCGVIGVVRVRGRDRRTGFHLAGFHERTWDPDCCRSASDTIRIPVGEARVADIDSVIVAIQLGIDVRGNLTSFTHNPWADLFDDPAYILFMRGVLPFLNGVCCLFAILALCESQRRVAAKAGSWTGYLSLNVVSFALLTASISCAIRTVYLAGGALFSTSVFPYVAHLSLSTISLSLQIIVCGAMIVMLKRVGAMKIRWCSSNEKLNRGLALAGSALLVGQDIGTAMVRDRRMSNFSKLLLFTYGLMVLLTLVFSFAFMYYGVRFIMSITTVQNRGVMTIDKTNEQCTRKRFVTLTLVSALLSVCEVIVLLPPVIKTLSITDFGVIMFLFYFLTTCVAGCQILAFAPRPATPGTSSFVERHATVPEIMYRRFSHAFHLHHLSSGDYGDVARAAAFDLATSAGHATVIFNRPTHGVRGGGGGGGGNGGGGRNGRRERKQSAARAFFIASNEKIEADAADVVV